MTFCLLIFIFNHILYGTILLEFMPYGVSFATLGEIYSCNPLESANPLGSAIHIKYPIYSLKNMK